MALQDDIVRTAREYLGTRWVHQGRVKGVGVDCIGLLVGVAKELGLTTFDNTNYTRMPDGDILRDNLNEHMVEMTSGRYRPGDVLMMKFVHQPQHIAIVTDLGGRLGIIHAHMQSRKVVEHGLDALWISRIVAVYRFEPKNEVDHG